MIKTLYTDYQYWSGKGSVYLISDTHFEDEDRLYMGYNISEQEQINILKKYCHKNDTLVHLGDVGNPEWMNQLKCYKVLVMGNHDQSKEYFEQYFDKVYPGPITVANKLVLSHEPIEMLASITGEPIAFNIHGHLHDREIEDKYHTNLASNICGFIPLNLKEAIKTGVLREIDSIHRQTIDKATERKELRKLKDEE